MGKRGPLPRVYHSAEATAPLPSLCERDRHSSMLVFGSEVCRDGPAAGMMVVFGGRTAENKSLKESLREQRAFLNCFHRVGSVFGLLCSAERDVGMQDTWGLRQHRDGRWDWVEAAPQKHPLN